MANVKKAILQAKINGVLTDLMVKTTGEMVFLNGTTTLAAKLAEMITSLNGKITNDDLTAALAGYVQKEEGKGLSTVDFTSALLEKLNGIAAGAQVNVIEKIMVNGVEQQITGKTVDIPVSSYTIEKAADSGEYAAVYQLKKDGVVAGVPINIPKDMVVQSGSVVTNPEGQPAGTYIVLVLQNVAEPLYINVGSLIEYVTSGSAAGDAVVISVDELTHKVTATITDGTITKAKLASALVSEIDGKVDKEAGKRLMTDEEGTKLAGIAEGAQVNVLEGVQINGADATITGKKVNIPVPTGALARKDKVAEADLDDALKGKVHTHGNKSVLDAITQEKVDAWTGKSVVSVKDTSGQTTAGVELLFQIVE